MQMISRHAIGNACCFWMCALNTDGSSSTFIKLVMPIEVMGVAAFVLFVLYLLQTLLGVCTFRGAAGYTYAFLGF